MMLLPPRRRMFTPGRDDRQSTVLLHILSRRARAYHDALSGTLVVETTRRAFGEARQEVDIYTAAVAADQGGSEAHLSALDDLQCEIRNLRPVSLQSLLASPSIGERGAGESGWKRDEEVTALLEANRGSS